jgi:hypothetical protein
MTNQKTTEVLERYGLLISDLERVEVLSKRHFGGSLDSIDPTLYEGPFQVLFLMISGGIALSEDRAVWLVTNWGPQSKEELENLSSEVSENDLSTPLDFESNDFDDLVQKAAASTNIYTTDFEKICEILSEFSSRLKSDTEVMNMFDDDFHKIVSKGLYLANQCIFEQKKLNRKDRKDIDFAWRVLLESCDIGDIGFDKLDDILFR